uniref:Uncharacterized protein n=1 Tax=Nelumbo nucifera TaxID=4432 RepID=A0A822XVK2_NELNU|nr:TPA_asm: hypothetical protein HUJ06_025821 [Nelumbo nucifera]
MNGNQPEATTNKLRDGSSTVTVDREIDSSSKCVPRSDDLFYMIGLVINSKLDQFVGGGYVDDILILTDDLGMKLTHAATIANVHDGLTAFLLIGAFSLANLVDGVDVNRLTHHSGAV